MPDILKSLIPLGTIMKWSGTLATIPDGWQICDGTNGTPNLLAKFVRGVATGSTNPGSTGGTDSVTLSSGQLPTHGHSITDPQHSHGYTAFFPAACGPGGRASACGTPFPQSFSSNTTGITVGNTGGGGSHENRPAYYEVAFIMKIVDA